METPTKCYCGHTTYCDCGPKEEQSKQETLKEAAKKYAEGYRCPATNTDEYCKHDIISAIKFGAKWQQERMYSEEEVDKLISDFKHDLRESTSNYVKQNCEGAIFGLERLKQFNKEDKQ